MRIPLLLATLAAVCLSASLHAQEKKPDGATGQCKDGSYSQSSSKHDACSGHGGAVTWYGPVDGVAVSPSLAPKTTQEAASNQPAAMPAPSPKSLPGPEQPISPMSSGTQATGGGAKVWVNTSTKVYHCPSDRYYGKTKSGQYMTEQQAIAAGDHADHGKSCSAK